MAVITRYQDLTGRTYRLTPEAMDRALKRVYVRRGGRALVRVIQVFGLKKVEAGRLFGVKRQAINQWIVDGVPPLRMADVARTAEVAQQLRKLFKPERVPAIVRGELPGLGGRSILETIRTAGTGPVFEMLERFRSYVSAA